MVNSGTGNSISRCQFFRTLFSLCNGYYCCTMDVKEHLTRPFLSLKNIFLSVNVIVTFRNSLFLTSESLLNLQKRLILE